MIERVWISSRQAYTPRLWPMPVLVVLIVVPVTYFAQPGLVVVVVVPALFSFGAVQLQWWIWRRRHPVVPIEELARRQAMWN